MAISALAAVDAVLIVVGLITARGQQPATAPAPAYAGGYRAAQEGYGHGDGFELTTCEQLWQERSQGKGPKSPQEQHAIQMLQADAQMRAEFINRVAAPIANKLFECGMIP